MQSDGNGGRSHVDETGSLEMKKDDKFFTRIMSKETSMANSSCRVYYGGASGTIPFTWESAPGTPKHILFSDQSSNPPPLTPPPSYYSSSSKSKYKSKSMHARIKPKLLNTIFPRMAKKTSHYVSPSSSLSSTTSSSSCSSWSSFHSSPAVLNHSKSGNRPCIVCSRSFVGRHGVYNDDDDDDYEHGITPSRLCYGGKSKAFNTVFGGCFIMENVKHAFFSIVGHGNEHGHGSSKANY